nr:hypothetical protein [Tanacetum cinerariifolium]
MEQENIQERSVLSIDYYRSFIQVTAVSIEFIESSMPMRQTRLKRIKMINGDAWVKDSIFTPEWVKIRRNNGIQNIEYVEASPHDSELVSLKAAEIVIPEVEEIKEDNLREKLFNVHLLIANIEALKDNPTQSSEFLTKSSSTSLNSLLEETSTFHNSLPEFENFYFDLGEISSGSTTTHCDISLPDYEAFYFDDDHIKEISSGSTTTHSDISLSEYDSFVFYPLNDQFPPTDRSDFTHEEFLDELTHITSPPKYDCFYFRNLPDPGELMSILNSEILKNLSFTT